MIPDNLSKAWQPRFEFYENHGSPMSSLESRAALKQLSFGERIRINVNFLAFFFGALYFFVKGMWRKGLTILLSGIGTGIILLLLNVNDTISNAISFVFAYIAMSTANYAYYLHVTRQSKSWNPFEGLGSKRSTNEV